MINCRQIPAQIGLISVLVSGGIALLLLPEPAQAWSKGSYRSYSGYGYGHHRYGHHGYGRRYGSTGSYGYYRAPRSCSQVTKTVHIDGRPRKVTGTRCYDSHGNPYIVSGSRRLGGYDD